MENMCFMLGGGSVIGGERENKMRLLGRNQWNWQGKSAKVNFALSFLHLCIVHSAAESVCCRFSKRTFAFFPSTALTLHGSPFMEPVSSAAPLSNTIPVGAE